MQLKVVEMRGSGYANIAITHNITIMQTKINRHGFLSNLHIW